MAHGCHHRRFDEENFAFVSGASGKRFEAPATALRGICCSSTDHCEACEGDASRPVAITPDRLLPRDYLVVQRHNSNRAKVKTNGFPLSTVCVNRLNVVHAFVRWVLEHDVDFGGGLNSSRCPEDIVAPFVGQSP